jgi:hypothetical protein
MRFYISIILILFGTYQVSAQHEWAPVGAKWHYTAPGTGLCVLMQSTGDTLINDVKFRIVEFRICGANELFCKEYFYQNGDSIFYYNYYHKSKYLLYNFAAKTGDSVIVHNDAFKVTEIFRFAQYIQDTLNYFKYLIDDVDSVMISGTWLKRQKISTLGNSEIGFYPSFAYLTEKLGSDLFPIGRHIAIPTGEPFHKGQLRCYSDDKANYVHPDWNHACDYMLSQSANLLMKDIVHLFPNPVVHNYLSITAPSVIKRIIFYNLYGVKIYETYPMAQNPTINLGFVSRGIYLVEITIADKDNPVVKKIIKQ